jgi:DNA-binding MarR family transcriptional regulator
MHALNPLFLRDEEMERHLELLLLAEREIASHGMDARQRANLSEAGFRTLYLIQRHPQTTMAELGSVLGAKKQSLSRHLHELIDAGYLTRDEDPSDRRKRQLVITKEGMAVLAQIVDTHKRSLRRAFLAAGPDAIAGFERVLGSLLDAPTRRFVGSKAA